MQIIDKEKAARVWERVQPRPPLDPGQILGLITAELEDAATYAQLAKQLPGAPAASLRRLYEQEQSHSACLKGIYSLITGTPPVIPQIQAQRGNPEAILRRCYGREMQSLAAYEAHSADPEYGQVFARLATQEREHCHILLTIIGSLKKNK